MGIPRESDDLYSSRPLMGCIKTFTCGCLSGRAAYTGLWYGCYTAPHNSSVAWQGTQKHHRPKKMDVACSGSSDVPQKQLLMTHGIHARGKKMNSQRAMTATQPANGQPVALAATRLAPQSIEPKRHQHASRAGHAWQV